jgi:hypothetical protein
MKRSGSVILGVPAPASSVPQTAGGPPGETEAARQRRIQREKAMAELQAEEARLLQMLAG